MAKENYTEVYGTQSRGVNLVWNLGGRRSG